MKNKRNIEKRFRGWLPKEFSLPSHQRVNLVGDFLRFHFLRSVYGVMLAALLVTPFGVYHSRAEPYVAGFLWGYYLPVGYVGLLLGILVILYPRLDRFRRLSLCSLMPFIGLTLLLSLLFFPSDALVNLFHGTSFSPAQIDIDYPVGHSAVLALSFFSIIVGSVSFLLTLRKKSKHPTKIRKTEPNATRALENRVRGWFPEEPSTFSIKKAAGRQTPANKRGFLIFSVVLLCGVITAGVFLAPVLLLNGESEADGWASARVVERIGFPGGDIVVWKHSQSPTDKGYLTLSIEAKVTSRETLAAYIDSRTNVLNQLLEDTSSMFEAIVTFKTPISPEEFVNWGDASVEKAGEVAVIWTDKIAGVHTSDVFWLDREEGYIQNITATKEGSNLDGIIAVECYLQPDQARNLQSDTKVLLIDPLEDPQMQHIKERYQSEGLSTQVSRPLLEEMWKQYAVLEGIL